MSYILELSGQILDNVQEAHAQYVLLVKEKDRQLEGALYEKEGHKYRRVSKTPKRVSFLR